MPLFHSGCGGTVAGLFPLDMDASENDTSLRRTIELIIDAYIANREVSLRLGRLLPPPESGQKGRP
jgi:hypothetical protein